VAPAVGGYVYMDSFCLTWQKLDSATPPEMREATFDPETELPLECVSLCDSNPACGFIVLNVPGTPLALCETYSGEAVCSALSVPEVHVWKKT
jgi:hypothetical protein